MSLIKKFTLSIFVISLLLSIYLIFKELTTSANLKGYYKAQSYIFIILLSLSFVCLLLSKTIQQYFLISFFSFLISLYFLEAFTYYKAKLKLVINTEDELINNELDLQNEIKSKKGFAAYSVNNDNLISFSGISNSKIILCNEDSYWSTYISDRNGFNNPDYVWDERKLDIVVLGDSMVHGACVNEGEDISSNIRKISNYNVINLGWTSTGPLAQYSTYLEYINNHPKYLVWIYDDSDLFNLKDEQNSEILNKYFNNFDYRQNLVLRRNEIDSLIKKKNEDFLREKIASQKVNKYQNLINLLKLHKIRQFYLYKLSGIIKTNKISYNPNTNGELNFYFEVIDKLKSFADLNQTKIIFVYLPPKSDSFSMKYKKMSILKEQIFKKFRKENIKIINIEQLIREKIFNPGSLYPKNHAGLHFNKLGYEFIAKNIVNNID